MTTLLVWGWGRATMKMIAKTFGLSHMWVLSWTIISLSLGAGAGSRVLHVCLQVTIWGPKGWHEGWEDCLKGESKWCPPWGGWLGWTRYGRISSRFPETTRNTTRTIANQDCCQEGSLDEPAWNGVVVNCSRVQRCHVNVLLRQSQLCKEHCLLLRYHASMYCRRKRLHICGLPHLPIVLKALPVWWMHEGSSHQP